MAPIPEFLLEGCQQTKTSTGRPGGSCWHVLAHRLQTRHFAVVRNQSKEGIGTMIARTQPIDAETVEDYDESCPTPERIRQVAAEIRKTWSRSVRRRRANAGPLMTVTNMPLTPRRKGFWGD